MIKLTGIGHVNLRVADQEASKRFYRDVLGFLIAEEDPDHGGVFMTLGDNFHTLDIGQHPSPQDAPRPQRGQIGLAHIAFQVGSYSALRDAYDHLVRNGVEIMRATNHVNQRSFYFADPDGNEVSFVEEITHEAGHFRSLADFSNETGCEPDFRRGRINGKISVTACMVTLMIGRFELPRVNDDKLANFSTRQQMDGRTARAAASHNPDDRVAKSPRSICAEKLSESFLGRLMHCEFAILGSETIASLAGLGHRIVHLAEGMDTARMFAYITFVVAIALFLNTVVSSLEAKVRRQ